MENEQTTDSIEEWIESLPKVEEIEACCVDAALLDAPFNRVDETIFE